MRGAGAAAELRRGARLRVRTARLPSGPCTAACAPHRGLEATAEAPAPRARRGPPRLGPAPPRRAPRAGPAPGRLPPARRSRGGRPAALRPGGSLYIPVGAQATG